MIRSNLGKESTKFAIVSSEYSSNLPGISKDLNQMLPK
jgi:hypothetical protein